MLCDVMLALIKYDIVLVPIGSRKGPGDLVFAFVVLNWAIPLRGTLTALLSAMSFLSALSTYS